MTSPIYLDCNATTPVAPEVAAAMRPWIDEQFGNPSSAHAYGQRARQAVAEAEAVRLSVGFPTSAQEIQPAAAFLVEAWRRMLR